MKDVSFASHERSLQHWGNPQPVSPHFAARQLDVILVKQTIRHQTPVLYYCR